MNEETQLRIFNLLDVLAVEVVESRKDISSLRTEMRQGFERVERRLGNVETRVESLETRVESLETRVGSLVTRVGCLETSVEGLTIEQRSFRQEFERRIAPLER